jgi:hypothetical protein
MKFCGKGFLNQFLKIGGWDLFSLKAKRNTQQKKEYKKSIYHMPGRRNNRGFGWKSRSL